MPKIRRKQNKNRTRTIYPTERPDKKKQKFALKDGALTEDAEFIDSKTSRKILEQARLQQNELEEEFGLDDPNESTTAAGSNLSNLRSKLNISGNYSDREADSSGIQSTLGASIDDDDDDDIGVLDQDEESARDVYESFYDELKINKEDEKALEMFMAKDNLKRKTLSEYIRDKLKEKEQELTTMLNDGTNQSNKVDDLDERVIQLYRGVKVVLQRYRRGPLPKAFKIIPALPNWEQILYITEPDTWTAAAMFQASRLFASNLKERMAQRFYNLILLPRLRDDIEEYKRLNFHLYQSLKKALFKPGAFFKGIIIPLCESGDCTLREAVIIGSVMAKNHIPLLHSCAAMLKIAEMDYSGANSIFLNILIQKKYALPYRVVDALFYHFYRFLSDRRNTLPVLWHQCLLAFIKNYKNDLSEEQKESIFELIRIQSHHAITPEIRRELFQSKNRDGTEYVVSSINNIDQIHQYSSNNDNDNIEMDE